ncbi:MAG: hypothetical protein HY676_02675 [Chloroflexi bacterium]|nr:hypothetical protein [Chloroflexota bacterium]
MFSVTSLKKAFALMISALALLLAACAPAAEPTATPRPTATPAPTFTPIPTFTPVPGAPTATPAVALPAPTAVATPTRAPAQLGPSVPTGTLTLVTTGDVANMIPGNAGIQPLQFYNLMFETLDTKDALTMAPGPLLAESWQNPDINTWIFKLRKDVVFHNGQKMTADDLIFSLDLQEKSKDWTERPSSTAIHIIKWEKTDDYTVKFTTSKWGYEVVGRPQTSRYIVPKSFYGTAPIEEQINKAVGTGPFKFVKWIKGEQMEVEAFDSYWAKGQPKVKRVFVRPVPELSTRMSALITGAADIIMDVTPDQAKRLRETKSTSVATAPGFRRYFTNIRTDLVKDARVREAMQLAIDRDSLVKDLFLGQADVLTSIVHPVAANKDLKAIPYDPARAKTLVQQAGYKPSAPLKLDYTPGRYLGSDQVLIATAQWLKEIGIPVDLTVFEGVTQSNRWFARQNNELVNVGWSTTFTKVGGLLFHTKDYVFNGTFWTENTEEGTQFDKMYSEAIATADPAKREKTFSDMEALWRKANPAILYLVPKFNFGVSSRVQNFVPRADQWMRVNEVWTQ